MKDYRFGLLILISLFGISCFIATYYYSPDDYKNNSTHVGEIYHRQLVNTIDSILDSRYPCGVTEDNNAYPYSNSFSSVAVPDNR